MKTETATEIRDQAERKRLTHISMSRLSPEDEALVLAEHYLSLIDCAFQLHRLIRIKRDHDGPVQTIDQEIRHLADDIKRKHLLDFGIELEWPLIK